MIAERDDDTVEYESDRVCLETSFVDGWCVSVVLSVSRWACRERSFKIYYAALNSALASASPPLASRCTLNAPNRTIVITTALAPNRPTL